MEGKRPTAKSAIGHSGGQKPAVLETPSLPPKTIQINQPWKDLMNVQAPFSLFNASLFEYPGKSTFSLFRSVQILVAYLFLHLSLSFLVDLEETKTEGDLLKTKGSGGGGVKRKGSPQLSKTKLKELERQQQQWKLKQDQGCCSFPFFILFRFFMKTD